MGVGAAVFAVTVIVIGWFSFHRDDEQPEAHLSEQNVAALEPIVGGHEGHPEKFLPAEEPVTISAALETVPPQIIEPGSRTIPRPTPRPQR